MMNSERHYPQVFKFAMVGMLAFDTIIFFNQPLLNVKIYCIIMFIAILNGWAASEDSNFEYGDLYLLVDALCSAQYLMILLELNKGRYEYFWLYSCILFFLYRVWNKLLEIQGQYKQSLRNYNACDVTACIFSALAFLSITYMPNQQFNNLVQYAGMVLWILLLFKWYYDFYFRTFLPNKTVL